MVLLTQSNPRLTSVGGDEGNYTRWIMHFLSLMNSMLVPAAYNACLSIEKRKTMSFHQYWGNVNIISDVSTHFHPLICFPPPPM